MTVDREQIRSELESLRQPETCRNLTEAEGVARLGLQLLAELEQAERSASGYCDDAITNYQRALQAERERDEAFDQGYIAGKDASGWREAALAEALRTAADILEENDYASDPDWAQEWDIVSSALAAYEASR